MVLQILLLQNYCIPLLLIQLKLKLLLSPSVIALNRFFIWNESNIFGGLDNSLHLVAGNVNNHIIYQHLEKMKGDPGALQLQFRMQVKYIWSAMFYHLSL